MAEFGPSEALSDSSLGMTLSPSWLTTSQQQFEHFVPPGSTINEAAIQKFLQETFQAKPDHITSEMTSLRLRVLESLKIQEALIADMERSVNASCAQTASGSASFHSASFVPSLSGGLQNPPYSASLGSIFKAWEFLLCYRRAFETFPKQFREFYVDAYSYRDEPFSLTSLTSGVITESSPLVKHLNSRLPQPGLAALFGWTRQRAFLANRGASVKEPAPASSQVSQAEVKHLTEKKRMSTVLKTGSHRELAAASSTAPLEPAPSPGITASASRVEPASQAPLAANPPAVEFKVCMQKKRNLTDVVDSIMSSLLEPEPLNPLPEPATSPSDLADSRPYKTRLSSVRSSEVRPVPKPRASETTSATDYTLKLGLSRRRRPQAIDQATHGPPEDLVGAEKSGLTSSSEGDQASHMTRKRHSGCSSPRTDAALFQKKTPSKASKKAHSTTALNERKTSLSETPQMSDQIGSKEESSHPYGDSLGQPRQGAREPHQRRSSVVARQRHRNKLSSLQ